MFRLLRKAKIKSLKGTALLRLDFNTEDEWRMQATVPTIRFLLTRGAKVLVVSHRGRPKGFEKKLSLRADSRRLQGYLHRKVEFISHFRFGEIKKTVSRAKPGSVFLLDNLRFLPGEEKNDPKLARNLANLADYYVNDAFAVLHRKNASVCAITKLLESYAGLELEKEIAHLSLVLRKPKKPIVVILGGAKAHDKLGVIRYFRNKAKAFLLGGAAANTILFLLGVNVRKSVMDKEKKDLKALKSVAHYKNVVLPVDWRFDGSAILDIGRESETLFHEHIAKARTIIWSGPLGMVERDGFYHGTLAVARAIAKNHKAFSLAGGGETVMFLKKRGLDKKFSFISTGGGAMLDFLAGEKLPGIEALKHSR